MRRFRALPVVVSAIVVSALVGGLFQKMLREAGGLGETLRAQRAGGRTGEERRQGVSVLLAGLLELRAEGVPTITEIGRAHV